MDHAKPDTWNTVGGSTALLYARRRTRQDADSVADLPTKRHATGMLHSSRGSWCLRATLFLYVKLTTIAADHSIVCSWLVVLCPIRHVAWGIFCQHALLGKAGCGLSKNALVQLLIWGGPPNGMIRIYICSSLARCPRLLSVSVITRIVTTWRKLDPNNTLPSRKSELVGNYGVPRLPTFLSPTTHL